MSGTWQEFQGSLVRLGWSQAYFARQFGLSAGTVSGWRKRDAAPKWALRIMVYLERLARLSAEAGEGLAMPRGRPRGRSAVGGWERSATEGGRQEVDRRDYGRKLDEWERTDLDQDSEEWGRG